MKAFLQIFHRLQSSQTQIERHELKDNPRVLALNLFALIKPNESGISKARSSLPLGQSRLYHARDSQIIEIYQKAIEQGQQAARGTPVQT